MIDDKNIGHPFISPQEIRNICNSRYPNDPQGARICEITEEFRQGFKLIEKKTEYRKSVTFFGSARNDSHDKHWDDAYTLAKRIGEELGYAIVTGGASGVMEAANHGGFDAKVPSIGVTVVLPREQMTNKYISEEIPFDHFFARKVLLAYSAEAYIFFPGGFGTFDELFGILTLRQTGKMPMVPVIFYGKDFWEPMIDLFKKKLVDDYRTVSSEELIFTLTEDHDEIISIIKNAPVREDE